MDKPIQGVLKEIGMRISNIGKIVDTDPNNDDEITSNTDKTSNDTGALANIIKSLKNMGGASASDTAATTAAADTASAAGAASAASDKSIKDISNTNTADIIEKAYKGLDDIIYKYNEKGQALGQDDKLRAGITAQSAENGILESTVIEDPETGYKAIDIRHLALANAAAIKNIYLKIDELEKLIKK